MKKKRFTEEQVAFALRQAESGVAVNEVCRKLQISEQTFYRWKKKFAGMGVAEVRRLNQLGDNRRHVAELDDPQHGVPELGDMLSVWIARPADVAPNEPSVFVAPV